MTTLPRLRELPRAAKLLVTAFLFSMGLNHIFASILTWQIAHSAAGSAKEHFQYKSLVYMLRMSHQHAFGHGIMYFALGGIFLLSVVPEPAKSVLILLPFIGATIDLSSWWLLKYAEADYEWLSAIGGTLFALGFAVMSLRIFWELWLSNNNNNNNPSPRLRGEAGRGELFSHVIRIYR